MTAGDMPGDDGARAIVSPLADYPWLLQFAARISAGVTMDWEAYLDAHRQCFIDELCDFIRIPSVSAKPENAADVRAAGQWVVDRLHARSV